MSERDALGLIEGLEQASKRARPFLIAGLLALLIGVALVVYSLEQQRREAVERADQAEQLVKTLQAAQRSGSRELVSSALAQAQDLRTSLTDPGGATPAPPAALPAGPLAQRDPGGGRHKQRTEPQPASGNPQEATPAPGPTSAEPTPQPTQQPIPQPTPSEPARPATGSGYYVVRQDLFRRSGSNQQALEALLARGNFGPFQPSARVNLVPGVLYYVIPLCAGQLQPGRSQLVRGGDRMPAIRC